VGRRERGREGGKGGGTYSDGGYLTSVCLECCYPLFIFWSRHMNSNKRYIFTSTTGYVILLLTGYIPYLPLLPSSILDIDRLYPLYYLYYRVRTLAILRMLTIDYCAPCRYLQVPEGWQLVAARGASGSKRACWVCGSPDHIARVCPKAANGKAAPTNAPTNAAAKGPEGTMETAAPGEEEGGARAAKVGEEEYGEDDGECAGAEGGEGAVEGEGEGGGEGEGEQGDASPEVDADESGLDKKTILLELSKALRHARDRKVDPWAVIQVGISFSNDM